ncbi:MAG: peptidoglycan-binding protein [Candidatus Colwellbacteria bacterium]|nr:peptidoglycan-binding protein [Candidatus Colwellbacteria bacterium]
MNTLRFFALLLGVVVFTHVGVASAADGTVVGFVTDAESRIVRSIPLDVFAYRKGQWREGSYDAATGAYSITLPPGTWYVGGTVPPTTGFTAEGINFVATVADGKETHYSFVLDRIGGVIRGNTKESSGSFISKTLINLQRLFSVKPSAPTLSSTANGDGSYEVYVPEGTYAIQAFSSPTNGLVNPAAQELTVSEGEIANLGLVFKKATREVFGVVLPNGAVGSGATVVASSDKHRAETMSDEFNIFRLKVNDGETITQQAYNTMGTKTYQSAPQTITVSGADVFKVLTLSLTATTLPAGKSSVFSGATGGTVHLANGMALSLPPQAVDASTVKASVQPSVSPSPVSMTLVGPAYNISLVSGSNLPTTAVLKRFVVEIPYDEGAVKAAGLKESALRLVAWDAGAGAWRVANNSVVDTDSNTVVGLTNYFARFTVADPQRESGGGGGGGGAGTPLPHPPSDFDVASVSVAQVVLKWKDSAIEVDEAYRLERDGVVIADNIPPTVESYTDTGVEPGSVHAYRIISFNPAGSNASPVRLVPIPADTVPPQIQNITVAPSQTSASISWTTDEPTTSVLSYGVTLGADASTAADENFVTVHTLATGEALAPGTAYQYTIAAKDKFGNESVSTLGTFSTPAAPLAPAVPSGGSAGASGASAGASAPALTPTGGGGSNTGSGVGSVTTVVTGSTAVDAGATGAAPSPIGTAQPSVSTQTGVQPFTKNLGLGSTGSEVTLLQQFLAKNKELYPQGIVSGYFGPLTKAAVIRFQNKYASTVLAPIGLSAGTGYVGTLTRAELNERYGKELAP